MISNMVVAEDTVERKAPALPMMIAAELSSAAAEVQPALLCNLSPHEARIMTPSRLRAGELGMLKWLGHAVRVRVKSGGGRFALVSFLTPLSDAMVNGTGRLGARKSLSEVEALDWLDGGRTCRSHILVD